MQIRVKYQGLGLVWWNSERFCTEQRFHCYQDMISVVDIGDDVMPRLEPHEINLPISSHLPLATILPLYQDGQMQKKCIDPWFLWFLPGLPNMTLPQSINYLQHGGFQEYLYWAWIHISMSWLELTPIYHQSFLSNHILTTCSRGWCRLYWSVAMSCTQLLRTTNGDGLNFTGCG